MFNQDTEVPGVGTLIASRDAIKHARRVDTNDAKDVAAFVAEAIQRAADAGSKKTEIEAIEAAITTRLNLLPKE